MLQKRRPFLISCLVLLAVLIGLDQWTKAAIERYIPLGDSVEMIHGFFELTHLRNTGMAFSMFDDLGIGFFIAVSILVIGCIIWYFFHTKDVIIELSLVLILAGAIGNLIDRFSKGYVTDFFQFYIFGKPFAVFNVADVCISIGFVFLVIGMFLEDYRAAKLRKEAAQTGLSSNEDPKTGSEQSK